MVAAGMVLLSGWVEGATLTVTTSADAGAGSLREQIAAAAPSGGIIEFAPSLAGQTIVLTSGSLVLSKDLHIVGLGANQLSISGGKQSRVFEIVAGSTVRIAGVTIRDGKTPDNPPLGVDGGGILNRGNLTLDSCRLTGNQTAAGETDFSSANFGNGGRGGAVFNGGSLRLIHCQVIGNATGAGAQVDTFLAGHGGAGGGIFNDTSATLRMDGCVVSGNQTGGGAFPSGHGGDGGGLYTAGTNLVVLSASTLAGNATGAGARGADILKAGSSPGGRGGHGAALCATGPIRLEGCAIVDNQTGKGGDGGNAGPAAGGPGASGGDGGGVSAYANLEVVNSTFSGNRTGAGGAGGAGGSAPIPPFEQFPGGSGGNGGQGGAIHAASSVSLRSCTVVSNAVAVGGAGGSGSPVGPAGLPGVGGGLAASTTTARAVSVASSLFAANRAPGTSPDVAGSVTSLGHNLVSKVDGSDGFGSNGLGFASDLVGTTNAPLVPGIGPLADHGGPTLTHALLAGSLAINAGTTGQLHAWQIADGTPAAGGLFYTNTLTAAQKHDATNSGWHFTVVSRLVAGSGGTGPAQFMTYGQGNRRFVVGWDANPAGQLTAELFGAGGSPKLLTAAGQATNDYHRHELVYDATTGNATYLFDGAAIFTWAGLALDDDDNGQALWGSDSTAGQGRMNYHQVHFAINGWGTVSQYDAGIEGSPTLARDPTRQGWTLTASAPTSTEVTTSPVSPDTVSLPPSLLDGLGLLYDQRGPGFPRRVGGRVDIGAYEFRPPSPPPVFTGIEPLLAGVRLQVLGAPNEMLRLEWSSQLVPGGWQTLATHLTDDSGNLVHTDVDAGATGQRYYRAVRP